MIKKSKIKIQILQFPILIIFLILAIISDRANPSRTEILADDTKIEKFTHSLSNKVTKPEVASISTSSEPKSSKADSNEKETGKKDESENTTNAPINQDTTKTKSATDESVFEKISPSPYPTPSPSAAKPTIGPSYSACSSTGGSIKEFGNSCGDSCALASNPDLQCLMVITESCDCGADKCWDGTECIANPTVSKAPTPSPSEYPIDPPIRPICGNGICELGEKKNDLCMVCDTKSNICSERACRLEFLCPEDCK